MSTIKEIEKTNKKKLKITAEDLLDGWYFGSAETYEEAVKEIFVEGEFDWFDYRIGSIQVTDN